MQRHLRSHHNIVIDESGVVNNRLHPGPKHKRIHITLMISDGTKYATSWNEYATLMGCNPKVAQALSAHMGKVSGQGSLGLLSCKWLLCLLPCASPALPLTSRRSPPNLQRPPPPLQQQHRTLHPPPQHQHRTLRPPPQHRPQSHLMRPSQQRPLR
jgi:hypothetical protein